ncbi:MAG: dTMP kinase [Burkholderiales bacterium]
MPGVRLDDLRGKLIVVEGTDGVGRTTQVDLLRYWLEQRGHAVFDTGQARSALAGKGIKRAKEGNTLNLITFTLYYATDFADRIENQIIPALRAGFIVLTDRYIYSQIARSMVRGADPTWLRDLFSIALVPSAIFYLKVDLAHLVPRVAFNRGFDFWESGMDMRLGRDMYESFCRYQTMMLDTFDRMSSTYGFNVVDANGTADDVFERLKRRVRPLLEVREPRRSRR